MLRPRIADVKPQDDPAISNETVRPVLVALMELGFNAPQAMSEPSPMFVPGSIADSMLEIAAQQLGEPALGLTLAGRIPIGALGTLDYAFVSSATMREALERAARYYGTTTQRLTLELRVEPPFAALVMKRAPGVNLSRHAVELSMAIAAERIRQTLGRRVLFHEVSFVHEAPADVAQHRAFFGVDVQFSQPLDRLLFPQALLDLPLRTAQSGLPELLEHKMREREPASGGDAFVDRVHTAVLEALDSGQVDVDSAVTRLGVTKRTLQRELKERGTSHTKVLDDIRRERAERLLAEGDLTVAEVARSLGFSEPSAFFRAYRRWTGRSPKAASGPKPE